MDEFFEREHYLEASTLDCLIFDLFETLVCVKYLLGDNATPEDKAEYYTAEYRKEVEALAEACYIFLRDVREPFKRSEIAFPPNPNSPLMKI